MLAATAQGPMDLGDAFPVTVDVDGDGSVTKTDRFILAWWLEQGGSLPAVMAAAIAHPDGHLDASEFFRSSGAQLASADSAQDQPATPSSSAGTGQALSGPGGPPCGPAVLSQLPAPVAVTVTPGPGSPIQAAIDTAQPSSGPYVIEVESGTYPGFSIDPECFPDGLIIFSSSGSATTTIRGTVEISDGLSGQCAGVSAFALIQIGAVVDVGPGIERHGFKITLGARLQGGGVYGDTSASVHVLGNEIVENFADMDGGGIALIGVPDAVIAYNVILANVVFGNVPATAYMGAGIFVQDSGGVTTIAENVITQNGFDPLGDPQVVRRGGGVYVEIASPESVVLCQNQVLENTGMEGAGIHVRIGTGAAPPFVASLQLWSNRIASNHPWLPATPASVQANRYAGLGLFLGTPPGFGGAGYGVIVAGNLIEDHDIRLPPGFDAGSGVATESGAGVFIECELSPLVAMRLEGNAIQNNKARSRAGGVYLSGQPTPGSGAQVVLLSNTIAFNSVDVGGLGGGLFVASGSSYGGSSNIVRENVLPGFFGHESDYFVETPVSSTSSPLDFSILPVYVLSVGGADLTGVSTIITTPRLGVNDYHIMEVMSPAIDSAEASLQYFSGRDLDEEPRLIDINVSGGASGVADRGADEATVPFVRGDANGDTNVEIGDAVILLAYLFNNDPLQSCHDAYDVDDLGTVDIADPVVLLNYLFNNGPEPVSPFPMCGPEFTQDDSLGLCVDANACP